ncbi:hypothetical protein BDF22DRAFT_700205 [Syncephalis plumigaleata]|nr:hypothetical protein BDF22DRAFT_700205 [Syncephalis plumigaleata]
METPTLDAITESILERIAIEQTLSESTLLLLHAIFDRVAIAALDLVDRRQVMERRSSTGRPAYEVASSSTHRPYLCLADSAYCSCASFTHSIIIANQGSMCKHLLAVRLAIALNELSRINMSDEAWTQWLMDITIAS